MEGCKHSDPNGACRKRITASYIVFIPPKAPNLHRKAFKAILLTRVSEGMPLVLIGVIFLEKEDYRL